MSPTRYRFSTPHYSGEPGFEPGQTESKSGVLPLDDSPIVQDYRQNLYFFSKIFQEEINKKEYIRKSPHWELLYIIEDRRELFTDNFINQSISKSIFWAHPFISFHICQSFIVWFSCMISNNTCQNFFYL